MYHILREGSLENCPDIMTTEVLANALSISKGTVYSLVKSGELPAIKIGRQYRFSKKHLLDYIDRCYSERHIIDVAALIANSEERSVKSC